MAFHYDFLPSADADVVQIDAYLRPLGQDLAESFLDSLRATAKFYAQFPLLGSPVVVAGLPATDLRWGKIKKFRKYLFVYRPAPMGVDVVRVIYGQQNLADVLAGNV